MIMEKINIGIMFVAKTLIKKKIKLDFRNTLSKYKLNKNDNSEFKVNKKIKNLKLVKLKNIIKTITSKKFGKPNKTSFFDRLNKILVSFKN